MNGYNRIARSYDFLSKIVFGKSLTQSQTYYLSSLARSKSVLVLGGGTSWWLNDFITTYPQVQITFIDASSEMIRIAKEKTNGSGKINFIHGTEDSIPMDITFDAVVVFYFLDLFTNDSLPGVIKKISQTLSYNALWLATDFVNEKKWHSLFLKLMYAFFHLATGLQTSSLPKWQVHLSNQGLIQSEHTIFYNGFIYSSVYK